MLFLKQPHVLPFCLPSAINNQSLSQDRCWRSLQELFLTINLFNYYILSSVETPGIYIEIHSLTLLFSVLLYLFFYPFS